MPRRTSSRSPGRRRRRSSSRSPKRRHDSSHDRKRERDSSRERRRRRSRSSSRDKEEKKFVNVRQKLRDGLSAASSTPQVAPEVRRDDSPPTSSLARLRQIESIENEGFRQAQFKATGGGAGGRVYAHQNPKNESRAQRMEKAEKLHEATIFGPSGRPSLSSVEESVQELTKTTVDESPISKNLSQDPEVRKDRWLKIWRERRQALGIC